jgi:hypothetical protein
MRYSTCLQKHRLPALAYGIGSGSSGTQGAGAQELLAPIPEAESRSPRWDQPYSSGQEFSFLFLRPLLDETFGRSLIDAQDGRHCEQRNTVVGDGDTHVFSPSILFSFLFFFFFDFFFFFFFSGIRRSM